MNSEKYIGLDVHQATIVVAVTDSSGKLIMESILETEAAPRQHQENSCSSLIQMTRSQPAELQRIKVEVTDDWSRSGKRGRLE